jgi:hypothetical protein
MRLFAIALVLALAGSAASAQTAETGSRHKGLEPSRLPRNPSQEAPLAYSSGSDPRWFYSG